MVWSEEEVKRLVEEGNPIFHDIIGDFVWTGNVDLNKYNLPEKFDEDSWPPGHVVMRNHEGLNVGHINAGRKVSTQLVNAQVNVPYWNAWHDIMRPKFKKWMAQYPMNELWGKDNYEYADRGQIIKYEKGHYFGLHQDGGAAFAPRFRIALGLLFFSDADDYEGGYFRIPAHGFTKKFTRGDYLIFPSAMFHELTPITSGTRIGMFSEIYVPNSWTMAHGDLWNDQTGINVDPSDSSMQRDREIQEHYADLDISVENGQNSPEAIAWLDDGWYPTPYDPKEDE